MILPFASNPKMVWPPSLVCRDGYGFTTVVSGDIILSPAASFIKRSSEFFRRSYTSDGDKRP